LEGQQNIVELSSLMILVMVMLFIVIGITVLRFAMYSGSSRNYMYRTSRDIDKMNENLREVKQGMTYSGLSRYGRHKAVSEITDTYYGDQSKDLKRIEEIKLQLSAKSLFDGGTNDVLVNELKELQDKRKFHGINIVIKPRHEDDYREHESIIKGDDDDDTLVSYK
jgi:hypothetical protein